MSIIFKPVPSLEYPTLYQQLKHASHSIEQIAKDIAATTILTQAHQILSQNYRRKRDNTPSNQITLGL